jgi:phage-Barnase-EndoU-ColicinE5/D-RelE like nuclease3
LYDECLTNLEPFHRKIDLFVVPELLAKQILEATKIDVTGFWVCIDNFGILHTLESHGNPVSEAKRGQIAVEKIDFVKLLEVFLEPDEIVLVRPASHTQKSLLQFIKKIEDKIYVVKEVWNITSQKKNKKSRLVFHTMYKIRTTTTS